MRLGILALLALMLLGARPTPAHAQEQIGWRYFIDGGALPFAWGSGAVWLTNVFIEPPNQPRLFSGGEGGEPHQGDTIPNAAMLAGSVGSLAIIAAVPSPSRWYHGKGIAQAILTTGAVTEVTKNIFGRRRPSATTEDTSAYDRRSFFSGHASSALTLTTYLGLYSHFHIFSRWREPEQSFVWWEALPLAGLAALAVYIPYSRVDDNRHHPSDVITGAAVGAASAVGFFVFQELRFRGAVREASEVISLAPWEHGMSIVGTF